MGRYLPAHTEKQNLEFTYENSINRYYSRKSNPIQKRTD